MCLDPPREAKQHEGETFTQACVEEDDKDDSLDIPPNNEAIDDISLHNVEHG